MGSTDVHEYASHSLVDTLEHLGIEPVVAGTSIDPDEFAEIAREVQAEAIRYPPTTARRSPTPSSFAPGSDFAD